jgi:hypothetical protein
MTSKIIITRVLLLLFSIVVSSSSPSISAESRSISNDPYFEIVCAVNNFLLAPSNGTSLHYVIMTNNETTKQEILHDDNKGHEQGWDPDGVDSRFSITDKNLNINQSAVFINTDDNTYFNVCFVDWIHKSSTAEADIQSKIDKVLSRFGGIS